MAQAQSMARTTRTHRTAAARCRRGYGGAAPLAAGAARDARQLQGTQGDRQATSAILDRDLRRLVTASDAELTYTCAPLGSGRRIGIDRDLDGALDGDERAAGSDPADPSSTPWLAFERMAPIPSSE
jgi:hypothetical protein